MRRWPPSATGSAPSSTSSSAAELPGRGAPGAQPAGAHLSVPAGTEQVLPTLEHAPEILETRMARPYRAPTTNASPCWQNSRVRTIKSGRAPLEAQPEESLRPRLQGRDLVSRVYVRRRGVSERVL